MRQRVVSITGAVVLMVSVLFTSGAAGASAVAPLSKVRHVFVIVLENEGFSTTFGPNSPAPYLAETLPTQGALLTQYFGIGHESNDNYLAMISGQAPNPDTQGDCQVYSDFAATGVTVSPGQAVGAGCVFPGSVKTVANQLTAAGRDWRGYMEDMGNSPTRDGGTTCGHPALNSRDGTQSAVAGDGYATRHDPFVYFHSIIDNQSYCQAHVVPLLPSSTTAGLAADLQLPASAAPSLFFVVPDLCDDGHDPATSSQSGCTNEPGPGGLVQANTFLSTWVPKIMASPAYLDGGLLVINFDEASTTDATACCNEQPGPNSPLPGVTGPGGGRTGAVVLSPFIKGGTVSNAGYNHYSLLLSIETAFGLPALGEAGQTGLQPLGPDVFTGSS